MQKGRLTTRILAAMVAGIAVGWAQAEIDRDTGLEPAA